MDNQQQKPSTNKKSNSLKAVLIVAGVGVISCFLPAVNFKIFSMSITSLGGEGYLVLFAFLTVLVLNLFNKEFNIEQSKAIKISKYSIIAGIIIWVIFIFRMLNTAKSFSTFGVKTEQIFNVIGIGFYLINVVLIIELVLLFTVKIKQTDNNI